MRPLGAGRELAPGLRVLAHLARSNVLDVYDAFSERRAARVVVKTLRPDRRGDRAARTALLREGRLLRRSSHPHIVRAYEVHDGERPFVVLETLGGETLAHLLERRDRRLGTGELAHLGGHLASALHYLHGEGILHLDLKPSNVVADGGRAKLLDLSIAQRPGRVRAGRGTWCNMAPEQARGGIVGPAADVWGLGTVLYEAATGENPFLDLDQLVDRAPPVRGQRRLPSGLARLIDASLDPVPERRPAVADLLATLSPLPASP